jgi:hypothetical protein
MYAVLGRFTFDAFSLDFRFFFLGSSSESCFLFLAAGSFFFGGAFALATFWGLLFPSASTSPEYSKSSGIVSHLEQKEKNQFSTYTTQETNTISTTYRWVNKNFAWNSFLQNKQVSKVLPPFPRTTGIKV